MMLFMQTYAKLSIDVIVSDYCNMITKSCSWTGKKKIPKERRQTNTVLAENRVSISKSSLWYTNYSFRGDQETQYSRLLDTYEIKNISKRLNIDDSNFSVSSSSVFRNNVDDHQNSNHDYCCDDRGLL
ncbi:hypothetical protein V5N11_017000 [Cardamine amara subsp. amara]|uniref:Uncharacterized protein n=1 Tax=Cardamine amara subsp. amara TaxID=228776 RepID=A0ABD1BE18_CARAN